MAHCKHVKSSIAGSMASWQEQLAKQNARVILTQFHPRREIITYPFIAGCIQISFSSYNHSNKSCLHSLLTLLLIIERIWEVEVLPWEISAFASTIQVYTCLMTNRARCLLNKCLSHYSGHSKLLSDIPVIKYTLLCVQKMRQIVILLRGVMNCCFVDVVDVHCKVINKWSCHSLEPIVLFLPSSWV